MSHLWDTHQKCESSVLVQHLHTRARLGLAVFPILAEVVEVKTASPSTAHWLNDFIRLNGWLRSSFAQLINLFEIDGIGKIGKTAIHAPRQGCPNAACRNLGNTSLRERESSHALLQHLFMARRQRMIGSEHVPQQMAACCDRAVTVL